MFKKSVRWFELQTTLVLEVITRALLSIIFLELEQTTPFIRKIHLDEVWLYKNPRTSSYVPTNILFPLVFLVPTTALTFYFIIRRNKTELCQGLLALSLALGLNGVLTNIIKVIVGRPRPDFFYRCFPDGNMDLAQVVDIARACKGEEADVIEGRKSFPSGHASFSFCSLGFLSLWLCGKMGVFRGSRSEGWKLVFAGLPLLVALIIALSRTCDYHHHWQDVLVGSLIGSFVAYLCYRQYYPRLSSSFCHLPYRLLPSVPQTLPNQNNFPPSLSNGRPNSDLAPLYDPESPLEEQVKWI